jgi:sugar phosphate isomerase/epimerase
VTLISRRAFFEQCSLAAAVALTPRLAAGAAGPRVDFPTAPRDRICVASYPFREFIAGHDAKPGNGPMDLKDFAPHVKAKFQINKIEPWTGHFPSTDPRYLAQFRAALDKCGCQVANMAVDGEDSPYSADPAERARAVAFSKRWVDIAVVLGAPGIRTNLPAAHDSQPDLARTADTLRRVVDYAAGKNIVISLENDNPVSEDPFFIVKLIEKVNSPWLHALPDFANTLAHHDPEYAYRATDAMFAQAYSICHVKETELTEKGTPVHVDLARTFGYLKQHAYKGYCSIEWDSPGDPYAGTADLIAKTIRYLS